MLLDFINLKQSHRRLFSQFWILLICLRVWLGFFPLFIIVVLLYLSYFDLFIFFILFIIILFFFSSLLLISFGLMYRWHRLHPLVILQKSYLPHLLLDISHLLIAKPLRSACVFVFQFNFLFNFRLLLVSSGRSRLRSVLARVWINRALDLCHLLLL